jgi:hypothetical protein
VRDFISLFIQGVKASIKPRKVNKPPRKVYQYNKANTDELKEKLRSIDIEKQLKEQDLTVDQLWNNFKEKVLNVSSLTTCSRQLSWQISSSCLHCLVFCALLLME